MGTRAAGSLADGGATGAVTPLHLGDVHHIAGPEIALTDSAAETLDDLPV